MTESNFRALCVELHAAVQLYTGQNPAAAGIPANELVTRLMDAMANTAAALAQPEPQGPTDKELLGYMLKAAASVPGGQCTGILDWDKEAIAAARAVLARWGTPSNALPVPEMKP
jgi:hypothetical protein